MGKKLFLVVNVLFITLIGILFYQAFNIYIMKESLKKDIVNLEKEVLFSRKFDGKVLGANGTLIRRI